MVETILNFVQQLLEYLKEFEAAGIKIVYFPYTKGISSTKISAALKTVRGE